MINPHEQVSSFEQTAWLDIMDVMRRNLYRLACLPKLTPEEIGGILQLMAVAKNLEISLLAFDDELAHYRDNIGSHKCGEHK